MEGKKETGSVQERTKGKKKEIKQERKQIATGMVESKKESNWIHGKQAREKETGLVTGVQGQGVPAQAVAELCEAASMWALVRWGCWRTVLSALPSCKSYILLFLPITIHP